MRVYHFLKPAYGLQAIQHRRLKIARLNALNDPFEFLSFSMKDEDNRRLFREWRDGMDADHGLLCFSSAATNPVQWSHYGANHTGVCLGFDVPDEALIQVKYRSRRGNVDPRAAIIAGDVTAEQMMREAISTKYVHWRYENEWRLFVELDHGTAINGLYFCDFSPALELRQVIVGPNSNITRAEVAGALNGMANVETYKARLAYQTFSVVKNRNGKLWK
jgi:hypothetical protein